MRSIDFFNSTKIQHHSSCVFHAFSVVLFHFARDRLISEWRQPERMTTLASPIVERLRVLSHPLIPQNDCPGLISDTTGEVLAAVDKVEQELQHVIFLTGQYCRVTVFFATRDDTYLILHRPSQQCFECKKSSRTGLSALSRDGR
jgi:hypothetical protein